MPLVADLEQWLRSQRAALARHNPVAGAIDHMLKDWAAFSRFLDDGRICLTNNAAERALRGVAFGRKAWLFAGSDRGGERAAFMYTLIGTAKLNDIDPQAWLADVLARIADIPPEPALRTAPVELAATSGTAQGRIAAVLTRCFAPRHRLIQAIDQERFAHGHQLGGGLSRDEPHGGDRLDTQPSAKLAHELAFAHAGLTKHDLVARKCQEAVLINAVTENGCAADRQAPRKISRSGSLCQI